MQPSMCALVTARRRGAREISASLTINRMASAAPSPRSPSGILRSSSVNSTAIGSLDGSRDALVGLGIDPGTERRQVPIGQRVQERRGEDRGELLTVQQVLFDRVAR